MKMQGRIHFVGIGGHGMSSIAKVLLEMGFAVSGSDVSDSPRLRALGALGARVQVGHSASSVEGAGLVVVSAAVPRDNVEVSHARKLDIPTVTRADMLAKLMNDRFGIAVTGTHGKTTTSSMVATVLIAGGLDPTAILGEEVDTVPGGGRHGKSEFVVAEADEAFGSFLKLWPKIAVVTNIDNDHLDYYGSPDAITRAFLSFLTHLPENGLAVLAADDARVMSIEKEVRCRKTLYGITSGELVAERPAISGLGYSFDVVLCGTRLGRLELAVPGRHNISNALASVAVGMELGVPFEVMRRALSVFRGARRRSEILGEVGGVLVMDDYAHHPTEIKATLTALKETTGRRIIAVFQPQRFTRTKLLFDEFARAFLAADVVVITEIFHQGTGEDPIPDVSGEKLAQAVEAYQDRQVTFIADLGDIAPWLLSVVQPGDLVVTMGAGNINTVAQELVQRMRDDWQAQT